MNRWLVGSLFSLACVTCSTLPVCAAGPRAKASVNQVSLFSLTVTASESTANMETANLITQPNASGTAVYKSTQIELVVFAQAWSVDFSSLSVNCSNINSPNGTAVVFEKNDNKGEPIGSAIVKNGSCSLVLSTQYGDNVPAFEQGDNIKCSLANVLPPLDEICEGDFGAPVITVKTYAF